MCLGQCSHLLYCHISSTQPGRSSFCHDVLVVCDLCSKWAPLPPSPKAGEPGEGRFSWRLCWELWWKPFLCFWLTPWVTLLGLQSALELLWVWMSELSSSQDKAGLGAAGAAPTSACWQRKTHIRAVFTQQSPLLPGKDATSTYPSLQWMPHYLGRLPRQMFTSLLFGQIPGSFPSFFSWRLQDSSDTPGCHFEHCSSCFQEASRFSFSLCPGQEKERAENRCFHGIWSRAGIIVARVTPCPAFVISPSLISDCWSGREI